MLYKQLVGNSILVSSTFKDFYDSLIDPATVTLKFKNPVTGVITARTFGDGSIKRESIGEFNSVISLTEPGDWIIRWEGTGEGASASEIIVKVVGSCLA